MNERTLKFKFIVVIFAVKLTVQKLYLNIIIDITLKI
jgi:hypothetical protein